MNYQDYSGRDNLDAMKEAINYNEYLSKLTLSLIEPADVVVDFGAGSGTFAKPLATAGFNIICVETDPTLYGQLQAQDIPVVNNLELLTDGSIDYLYSLNVLEHIQDDDLVLQMWFRKLRPGGRLLVFVPAFQWLYTSMDRKVGHMRRYSRKSLQNPIEAAGFRVQEIIYADSIGVLATLVYKLSDNGSGAVNIDLLKVYDRWVFPISRFFDLFFHQLFGKNLVLTATKPIAPTNS